MASKPVMETKNSIDDDFMKPFFLLDEQQPPKKKKLILFVIDAMRIDFALPLKHADCKVPFANKLTIMSELAKSDPQRAKMFKFLADPPTVTTQRLGSITGGTLSSFVEAFKNFAGETLLADNFVYQLLENPEYKNFHLLGDDTWVHLYPFILEKAAGIVKSFHSFNLMDLHTVDNGIKDHIWPIIEENTFDILITHFLGLDHCGHKFGPLHEECGRKLGEMNDVLKDVIDKMDSDTTLMVFGDHGMTDEGDHGGNTPREVSSALFVYNKKHPSDTNNLSQLFTKMGAIRNLDSRVESFYAKTFDDSFLSGTFSQIDFSSTIAALTNTPIPFGNLGAIIPEIFAKDCGDEVACLKKYANMYRWNSHQVLRFFKSLPSYDSEFKQFIGNFELAETKLGLLNLENILLPDLEEIILSYYTFLQESLNHCRRIWATYDYLKISVGVGAMILGFAAIFHVVYKDSAPTTVLSLIPFALFFLVQCLGKATNSFIITEDSNVRYLLVSIVLISFLLSGNPCFKPAFISMILIRVFAVFKSCREEQGLHCCQFNHRAVHPNSSNGFIFILLMISGLIGNVQPSLHSLAYVAAFGYQIYGWLHENLTLNEWIIQILLPRVLLASGLVGLITSFVKKSKSAFMMSMLVLLSAVQRPFSGWVLMNAAPAILHLVGKIPSDPYLRAAQFYALGMCLFFWTAHHAVITSIHWEVGFTGFKDLNQVRATFFIALNTFSGPIFAAIASITSSMDYSVFTILSLMYIAELIFDSIATATLLQHLMLWAIFTPRFIMQAMIVAINLVIYLIMRYIYRFNTGLKK